MDHNDIRHKLSEYLDGTSSPGEQAEIEAHLKSCEKCGDALKELRKTIEHIRTVEEVEPPAWMARKIMAQVRAEVEQKKNFSETLYSLFVVNLPVKAVAVLFLTAIAFYLYRGIGPQKLTEEPAPAAALNKQTLPSGIAKNDQGRPVNSPGRSRQLPQTPEYKSLDMKQEYEKPAPPVIQEKTAASAPAAAQPFAAPKAAQKKNEKPPESRAFADRQGASESRRGLVAQEGPQTQGQSRHSKAKAARAEESGVSTLELMITVADIRFAQREIEQITTEFGGQVIKTAQSTDPNSLIVSINADRFAEFLSRIKKIGEVKDHAPAATGREEYLTIRVTLRKK